MTHRFAFLDIAAGKSKRLLEGGCAFSEFGTRRRRSYEVHDLVLKGILRARNEWQAGGNGKGKVMGTSNVRAASYCRVSLCHDNR